MCGFAKGIGDLASSTDVSNDQDLLIEAESNRVCVIVLVITLLSSELCQHPVSV